MLLYNLTITKNAKIAIHPALGPIIELRKGQKISICEEDKIYNDKFGKDIIERGWAIVVGQETKEVKEVKGQEKKRGNPNLLRRKK